MSEKYADDLERGVVDSHLPPEVRTQRIDRIRKSEQRRVRKRMKKAGIDLKEFDRAQAEMVRQQEEVLAPERHRLDQERREILDRMLPGARRRQPMTTSEPSGTAGALAKVEPAAPPPIEPYRPPRSQRRLPARPGEEMEVWLPDNPDGDGATFLQPESVVFSPDEFEDYEAEALTKRSKVTPSGVTVGRAIDPWGGQAF